MILIVGPDGAGKSTVLDALVSQHRGRIVRAHSRPGLIAGRDGDGTPVTEPHAQTPRGSVASLLKLAVVFTDTVLGSWVRWRRQARSDLLVVERGWYDLAVDPHRYRLPHSFSPLVRLLGRLVPRAELIVLLRGDPAVLHERKPEIGAAEVRRQLETWDRLASRAGRRVLRIDTVEGNPEQAATEILAAVHGRSGDTIEARWLRVPVAPRRLDLRATGTGPALALYRPQRSLAIQLTRLNPLLLRTPLAVRVEPPVAGLAARLETLDRPIRQLVAFRSSAEGRWIVGVADQRRLHTVVKAGEPDDPGLAHEHAALAALTSTSLVTVPRLIGEWNQDGQQGLVLEALSLEREPPDLTAIVQVATTLVRGRLGIPVVHGDLAPWNVARSLDGTIAVWDWEESELDVVRPMYDLTHYIIRAGTLLGRFDPAEAARLLIAPAGLGVRHLTALGLSPTEAPDWVRSYLGATTATTAAERAFRADLAAALPLQS